MRPTGGEDPKEESETTFKVVAKDDEKVTGILRSASISQSTRLLSRQQAEPSSPLPSVDRLSVTFAITEGNASREDNTGDQRSPKICSGVTETNRDMQNCEEKDEEEDYSASACAIIQRRNSTRRQSRRKRRPSSPFGLESDNTTRRRSSALTTSSGDTAISIDEGTTQEQVFEKLKLHKEVLSGVKQQPWPLRKKIRLVRLAKSYVRKHEGVLQERLAQNRNTKDALARVSLLVAKKWQYLRRELTNLQTWLKPWELRIKEIESHFGSAVASYFTFLRWLFWINCVIAFTLTAFVAVPEILIADAALAGERKIMPKDEISKSTHLMTLWEFEGILRYSPFFYGWYTNHDSKQGYRLPLAYFITNLIVYVYSFVAILRKMAKNSRMSKLTEKEDECAFSWKLFTGWDFMIGNPETAHNRMASIIVNFKEALVEEAEKQKKRNWKIISMRIFVNICVIALLALSAFAVVKVVSRSAEEDADKTWWRQNEITIVVALISNAFPFFFEILGFLESYHPRKQLRIELARIMVLNFLNLYSLIFALFDKMRNMKSELIQLKPTNVSCKYTPVDCIGDVIQSQSAVTLASLSLVLMSNVSHTIINSDVSLPTAPFPVNLAVAPYSSIYQRFINNPILTNDTLYSDFNGTFEEYNYKVGDYPYFDYNNYDDAYFYDKATESTSTEAKVHSEMEENELSKEYNENFTTPSSDSTADFNSSFYDLNETDFTSSTIKLDANNKDIYFDNDDNGHTVTSAEGVVENMTFTSDIPREVSDKFATASNERVVPLSENNHIVKCYERVCTTEIQEGAQLNKLDLKTRKKLRRLCWETMFGQELAKLTVMDLLMTIASTLGMDFFRAVFVRFMNNCWCWDLEKQFPQYGDFKIAENILHLVNNQGMVWMGMFFSPGLAALNLLKLGILMYLRSWAVLTCNVPHEVVFRASRSNNFYFALLLTMLFLCVLPVGYAVVWVEPSWHCGPFSSYSRIYMFATESLKDSLPEAIKSCLDYITSASIVIPLIVLMTLIIYYMVSLTNSLREANNDLKIQLQQERTEERRKLFKIVENRRGIDVPLTRWKKILPVLPSNNSEKSQTSKDESHVVIAIENRELIEEIHDRERMQSTNSEIVDATETDQDSLRHCSTVFPYNYKMNNDKNEEPLAHESASTIRSINVLGDSWESQSSDYALIPRIRINEVERKSRSHCLSPVICSKATSKE